LDDAVSGARKSILGIAAVIVVIVLPGLLLVVAGRDDIASVSALAAVAGVMPALMVNGRVAVGTAVGVGLASALAVPVAHNPWGAALLMALAAGATGLTARIGASRAVVMAPISLAFLIAEPPIAASGDPVPGLLVGAVALVSALWGALAVAVLRKGHSALPPSHSSRIRTVAFALVLAVSVGGATWLLVDLDLGHGGAWFVMTLLIVLQPYLKDAWSRTLQRAAGTVVGFVIAMVIYALLDLPVVMYVLAAAFMTLAMVALVVQHRPYWQYVALLTPAVVLLEGSSGSVMDTALQRVGFTLLAAAIAVVIEVVLGAVLRGLAERRSTRRASA
jgi:hypothetical protein